MGALVYGYGGDDRITGLNSNDQLYSGDGDDVLIGGDGDDVFVGGAGNDVFYGGQGADSFVFEHDTIGGHDVIRDFKLSEHDSLNLSNLFHQEVNEVNFNHYISFDKNAYNTITLSIDLDGEGANFDKVTVAELHTYDNIDNTLSQLNQGIGVIL